MGPVTKDPAQKEKDECNKWMQDSLDALSRHIEQNEAEIECLENKKRLSKNDQGLFSDTFFTKKNSEKFKFFNKFHQQFQSNAPTFNANWTDTISTRKISKL